MTGSEKRINDAYDLALTEEKDNMLIVPINKYVELKRIAQAYHENASYASLKYADNFGAIISNDDANKILTTEVFALKNQIRELENQIKNTPQAVVKKWWQKLF